MFDQKAENQQLTIFARSDDWSRDLLNPQTLEQNHSEMCGEPKQTEKALMNCCLSTQKKINSPKQELNNTNHLTEPVDASRRSIKLETLLKNDAQRQDFEIRLMSLNREKLSAVV